MKEHLNCPNPNCGWGESFLHTAHISDTCWFCGCKYPADEVEAARRRQELWIQIKALHPRWKPSRRMWREMCALV